MDIDTASPTTHCDGKQGMQLDIPPSDDVMMEVDPDFHTRTSSLPQNPNSIQLSPTRTSSINTSVNARSLDTAPQALGPVPAPPVVLIVSSDTAAWPKFKVDQLFVEWLSRPESRSWLDTYLNDAKSGKAFEAAASLEFEARMKPERSASPGARSPSSSHVNTTASPQGPGSPISRLFNKHIPFGDSDSSPKSPIVTPTATGSPFRPSGASLVAGDLDLGKSGSASPLFPDQEAKREKSPQAARNSRALSITGNKSSDPKADPTSVSLSESVTSVAKLSKDEKQQMPDSKALDKVADGIAGMSAVVDHGRSQTEMASGSIPEDASRTVPENESKILDGSIRGSSDVLSTPEKQASEPTTERSKTELGDSLPSHISRERQNATASKPTAQISEASDAVGHLPPSDTGAKGLQQTDLSLPGLSSSDQPQVPSDSAMREPSKDTSTVMPQTRPGTPGAPPGGSKTTLPTDATMKDAVPHAPRRKRVPRFYFPCGREAEAREKKEEETMREFFKSQRTQKSSPGVSRADIAELVVEVIGLPSYFASIIFSAIQEMNSNSHGGSEGDAGFQGSEGGPRDDEMRVESNTHREEKASADLSGSAASAGGPAKIYQPGTNSDATMGDVDNADGDGHPQNGFHGGSTSSQLSAEVGRDPIMASESGGMSHSEASRDLVTEEQFSRYYNAKCAGCSKEARLFNALLGTNANRSYLIPNDFKPLLRALLMCHQGLAFLQATPEFQQRYSETVIERIYFGCTRQHNGRLTLQDIKRSKLLKTLMVVDEEEDINRERKYFSYEHFYVLYCRFWELDANHDLQIDREDLMRYGSHSLTNRIVDRIFGGYARPLDTPENPGFMSYTDFIWFCLSEEDKTSDTAIDYWFRCIDMDGDGFITMYDMEFFYKEQLHRMESFGHEPVQIRDILCQLLDMIKPNVQPPVITRRDLKRCKLAGNFYNVLFNLNKFFAIEARDPLQIRQEHATPELTDWDRFAALEYLRLSAEEEGEEDESWDDVGDSSNPLMAGEAPF